jgi:hypothetical protein
MKRLEARFHPPFAATEAYVVVGHVVADATGTLPRVEPARSLTRHGAPAAILATLKHLVIKTSPNSFQRLESLRSRYWSFVSVGEERSDLHDG